MPVIKARDIALALIPLLVAAALAGWLAVRDARLMLVGPLPELRTLGVTETIVAAPTGPRRYLDVALAGPKRRDIRFAVSLPPAPAADLEGAPRLPVLVLLTGFRSAHNNLERIPDHGANAIVSIDYPYTAEEWRDAGTLRRIWIAARVAYDLPDAVGGVLTWLQRQSWAGDVSLAGVSLGAIAMPVIQRRLAAGGLQPAATVLAYGATDLEALANANLDLRPAWLRGIAAWAVGRVLGPLDPADHLPHLTGPFLIINGAADERLPEHAIAQFVSLTPEPKTVITVEGGHIENDRPELIARTVQFARAWLAERGALNTALR